jgi:hypothetical protein
MPFITVNKGGPSTEIPDGVYTVTLVDITGPRTVTAQRGPQAGKDIDLLDWIFAIDGGPLEGNTIEASTSTASGPRSKLYGFLVALFGGRVPPAGTGLEKEQLVGRQALATVRTDEGGWPRIENLGALPNTMPLPQPAPMAPTNTEAVVPANGRAPVPARAAGAPVAQQGADLPF